ncbi:MAG: glycosyltransferase family 4 protein [Phycisphaerales bacterium]|nr:glycosyltransferase family 4 protein [Phycisphaerales bacterium]
MRVAFLVSGAGGMYCGSCLRDNRLAGRLIAQNRDVVLLPLYTPLKTDEPDAGGGRIYYGGLNVYLQQSLRFFRTARGAIDRILDARPLLRSIGRFASGTRPDDLGPLTVSILRGHDGAQKKELDKLIEALDIIRPDLINLPQLMLLGLAPRLKQALGVPIVCTLGGEDIFLDRLPQPHRDDALRLIADRIPDVDAFIAVTRFYADHATRRFELPPDRVHYVPMGVTVDAFACASPHPNAPFTIGYLARNCRDKGLHVLVDAFIRLRADGRDCRLRVAGFLAAADRPFFNEIRAQIRRHRLDPHVDFVGELDFPGKVQFLQSLHAFSVPAVYPEAKGLYILESLASGVPVVQPRSGSFPELVESTGGGILVAPDDPNDLADGLARLVNDPALRTRLAASGRSAVASHHNETQMADKTWEIYQRLTANRIRRTS